MSSLPVKPEFGPSLPELAGPRWRRLPLAARVAVIAVAALVVLGLGVLRFGGGVEEETVVVDPPRGEAFNLRHGPALARGGAEPGEALRLVQRREGREVGAFAARSLRLPAYRGSVGGVYPVVAERVIADLRARYADFEVADEGRVRINEAPGYGIGFRARRDGRRVWGRTVLLVPPTDPPEPVREGARLDLVASVGAGVSNAAEVGTVGQLKLPLRTFRFGTDPP